MTNYMGLEVKEEYAFGDLATLTVLENGESIIEVDDIESFSVEQLLEFSKWLAEKAKEIKEMNLDSNDDSNDGDDDDED